MGAHNRLLVGDDHSSPREALSDVQQARWFAAAEAGLGRRVLSRDQLLSQTSGLCEGASSIPSGTR